MYFENISINDVINKASQIQGVIIDVRPDYEYLQGHIPTAINIPYENIERGQFVIGQNRPLILYCDRGAKSMLASKYLSRLGYQVINSIGGIVYYRGKLEI